jgi:glycosyltransferase involved in cell wall biosynthesis
MLWIDVTDTYLRWTGGPTGIQRTLVGLAAASRSKPPCALCVRDEPGKTWRRLPAELFIAHVREPLAIEPGGVKNSLFRRLLDDARGFGKSLHHFSSTHFWLFHDWARDLVKVTEQPKDAFYVRESYRRVPVAQIRRRWRAFREYELSGFGVKHVRELQLRELEPIPAWSKDDAVLLADSHWNNPSVLQSLAACSPKPRILGFCHDLIPIERPDFVTDYSRDVFTKWFDLLAAKSDEILCNSEHSASRFRHHLRNRHQQPPVRSTVFGNKLEHAGSRTTGDCLPLASLLRRHGVDAVTLDAELGESEGWILWVGSVDIRKNLDVLLLAAEHLAASGQLRQPIVVAGRPSAGTAYYQWKMRRNPHLRRVIVFVDSPDDDFLSELKRGADLFLYTSWEEGYGLPVAEALQEGIPVIASKATSIPEVGGDLVEYFEPWNSGELAHLLLRFEQDEDFRRDLRARAARFVPTTWEQMLEDILTSSVTGRV